MKKLNLDHHTIDALEAFLYFLLKEGYTDTDVYAEPPTALDQFLLINRPKINLMDPANEPDPVICDCGWEMIPTSQYDFDCSNPDCNFTKNIEPDWDSMKGGVDYD